VRALLIAAAPAFAQEDPDDDEPPSQAAREVVVVEPPPPPPRPRKSPGRTVIELGALPGYMRLLGSDFLGVQLSLGVGGEARTTGFVAQARFGAFLGATAFGLSFEHFTVGPAFVIPTGTRFRVTLGQQFGVVIVQEPRTFGGYAYSLTFGGYLEPSIDLFHRDGRRLALVARAAYDFVFVNSGSPNAATVNLGITYSF
jgi:hypothetical protein